MGVGRGGEGRRVDPQARGITYTIVPKVAPSLGLTTPDTTINHGGKQQRRQGNRCGPAQETGIT